MTEPIIPSDRLAGAGKAMHLDAPIEPAEPVACAHSWRDWSSHPGGRNVAWCSKCNALAFTGQEDVAPQAAQPPAPITAPAEKPLTEAELDDFAKEQDAQPLSMSMFISADDLMTPQELQVRAIARALLAEAAPQAQAAQPLAPIARVGEHNGGDYDMLAEARQPDTPVHAASSVGLILSDKRIEPLPRPVLQDGATIWRGNYFDMRAARFAANPKELPMSELKNYRKKNVQPMRPYVPGEDMTGISVNKEDTPEVGGMIAINPSNQEDRWYVAKQFFADNYIEA